MNKEVPNAPHPDTPLVTVVTPCFNSGNTIADTLHSVAGVAARLSVAGWTLEHWIIDGGSTDGTLAIVSQHCQQQQSRLASAYRCHWQSSPDNGAYQAMNAGLAKATGHFCHIVNADDFILNPDIYASALQRAYAQDALIILSSIIYFSRPGQRWGHVWRLPSLPGDESLWRRRILAGSHYPHPGFIAQTHIYRGQGFDERFTVSADYKLMQSLLLKVGAYGRLMLIDEPIVAMAKGGQTGRWLGIIKGYQQLRAINRELGIHTSLWQRYSVKLLMRFSSFINFCEIPPV